MRVSVRSAWRALPHDDSDVWYVETGQGDVIADGLTEKIAALIARIPIVERVLSYQLDEANSQVCELEAAHDFILERLVDVYEEIDQREEKE